MPWSISAIQHRFLDTTGALVTRFDSILDDESLEDGYQGHLTDEIATEQIVTYLEATLTT